MPSKQGHAHHHTSPITDQQALELIAALTGDDFCIDMDMRRESDTEQWTPELKTAMDKLLRIWRISHSMVASDKCFLAHDDWREEAARAYGAIVQERGEHA